MKYLEIEFENAGDKTTEAIVMDLMMSMIDYEHITGSAGWLIGMTETDDEEEFEMLKSTIMDLIHAKNDGGYVDITEVSYESIEQYL